MPLLITNEKRKYTRYAHTEEESKLLKRKGLRAVISSNVSAVGYDKETLIVRFHGGATYGYPGQGERYDDLVSSPSKGKWVWRELVRKRVSYFKMGSINIKDDVESKDMMKPQPKDKIMALALLSTMIDSDVAITTGIIAGLALASMINSNAEEAEKNSRQA
jgi:hypothetical protein